MTRNYSETRQLNEKTKDHSSSTYQGRFTGHS